MSSSQNFDNFNSGSDQISSNGQNANNKSGVIRNIIRPFNIFNLNNIDSTQTDFGKYIPPHVSKNTSKSLATKIFLVYYISVIIAVILFMKNSNAFEIGVLLFGLLTGPTLLYIGFKEFSKGQLLTSMPVTRIDSASYGLNKMEGTFIPYNAQSLKSVISNVDCVYHSLGVYYADEQYNGDGTTSILVHPIEFFGKGVPTLLTDGTGYLAVDIAKMPKFEAKGRIIYIKSIEGKGNIIGYRLGKAKEWYEANLKQYIKDAYDNDTILDLSRINGIEYVDLGFYRFNVKSFLRMPDKAGDRLVLIELFIPTSDKYICIGSAADTGKTIDNKPVKALVPDPATHIISANIEGSHGETSIKNLSKVGLAAILIGGILTIAAFVIILNMFI
ncbi:MAG: hypothetical protein ARM1_0647 [Candidatus Micrarchaeota archaeon]|nr:MAG: hypothetical protein ARM1_0647 [Candidatus Micrarchaeota archaeon]